MKAPENQTVLRFALRFLKWFCPEHLYEEIEGDLIQKFQKDIKTFDEASAHRRFVWNVIRFFRPAIILRNRFSVNLSLFGMFNHFFKIFFQDFIKERYLHIYKYCRFGGWAGNQYSYPSLDHR